MDGAQQMKCVYCGAMPDSGGVVRHLEHCTLRVIGQKVPKGPPEGIEHSPFLAPSQTMHSRLEAEVRRICSEEIVNHINMQKNLQAFAETVMSPKPCEQCKKLQTMLGMARSALSKIAASDPVRAAQRAQAHMPAEYDIARMTIAEIERMEAEDGVEKEPST